MTTEIPPALFDEAESAALDAEVATARVAAAVRALAEAARGGRLTRLPDDRPADIGLDEEP